MSAQVEQILAEIGKAFRLCRFYPASHPSVQQALAGVSSALPGLIKTGVVELKITPAGFALAEGPIAARNPQVQELAGLLYTQGHRYLVFEPGLTTEEVSALIRVASGGERANQAAVAPALPQLPHIRMGRTALRIRKSTAPGAAPAPDSAIGRRSFGVFRPDALPADIEARRLAIGLEKGGPETPQAAARLGELIGELVPQGDFRTLTLVVRALGVAAAGKDPTAAEVAGRMIAERIGGPALSGLIARLGDASLPPAERDQVVHAVAALGARAMSQVAERYLVSSDDVERDILLAVVRRAGPAAAEALLERANPDARGDAACAWVRLLGATVSPRATLVLRTFALHGEARVREAAITALARVEDPEARRHTMNALRDEEARVRAAAAHGISRFGDTAAAPVLLARLGVEDDDAAAAAMIEALGELRDPRAVPALVELARGVAGVFQRHATQVRVAAVRALGAIGTPEALAEVRERLASRQPEVREAAAKVLGL